MLGQSDHISFTCDGNSTKSRGTLVPEKYGYFTSENMPCSAWPNSWNVVVTSSHVISVGSPAGGLGTFRWLATTGWSPLRPDCDTYEFIHAPPRLESRAYGSKMKIASCDPSALNTS